MFRRLLIANRGEIARRVIRTCRAMKIESVAVYSDIDENEPHVTEADYAEPIGPAPARESYLRIGQVVDAARRCGADAIHPGYGFLSENAEFADACRHAGLTFVGPSADVIARAGSKIDIRRLADSVGVPVVPGGTPADQTTEGLRRAIVQVGFPALIKASAGGGGKGMRTVPDTDAIDDAVAAARREAVAAFGDGTLYVERHLENPRHIEVQVVGDRHGHLVHLFERECSVQRRYQKVVEETPSPAVSDTMRTQLTTAATTVAAAAGYDNVGTVEFLLESQGESARFYFLEMNTRLQVEHAITEVCTGVDLVRGQLEVAAGQPLPWSQSALASRGHAIECRLYAEDPQCDFLPQAGSIALYREPAGPGLRIDSGVEEGSAVPVHYDPLLAKVIASAETRDLAIGRAADALRRYVVLGVTTNLLLLRQVLDHPRFRQGRVDTGLLDRDIDTMLGPVDGAPAIAAAAAAAVSLVSRPTGGRRSEETPSVAASDPWTTLAGWRLGADRDRPIGE